MLSVLGGIHWYVDTVFMLYSTRILARALIVLDMEGTLSANACTPARSGEDQCIRAAMLWTCAAGFGNYSWPLISGFEFWERVVDMDICEATTLSCTGARE